MIVAMLHRSKIMALVGDGNHPLYPANKVLLWDEQHSQNLGEIAFKTHVRAVKLRRDKIIVVLDQFVYIYKFQNLEQISKFETVPNPKGLVALSTNAEQCVLACPSVQKGVVRLVRHDESDTETSRFVPAHDSPISCLALNTDGSRLATASEKGTLIRIFDTTTGDKLHEVRRGADRAEIYSIGFNTTSTLLSCSSHKGTVHIFSAKCSFPGPSSPVPTSIAEAVEEEQPENRKSRMAVLSSFLPSYFSSEWSFAWYRGPECPSICCFLPDHSVIVVAANGTFHRLTFDHKQGGECNSTVSNLLSTEP